MNEIIDGNIKKSKVDKDITSTPSLALYKDGKALNALCPEWKKYF